jgi:hypothetical protein
VNNYDLLAHNRNRAWKKGTAQAAPVQAFSWAAPSLRATSLFDNPHRPVFVTYSPNLRFSVLMFLQVFYLHQSSPPPPSFSTGAEGQGRLTSRAKCKERGQRSPLACVSAEPSRVSPYLRRDSAQAYFKLRNTFSLRSCGAIESINFGDLHHRESRVP